MFGFHPTQKAMLHDIFYDNSRFKRVSGSEDQLEYRTAGMIEARSELAF